MTGFVTTADGRQFALPAPLEWRLHFTAGVPCDSFLYRCVWDKGGDPEAALWYRFHAVEGGETVFRGVVDECETSVSRRGALLEITGRGLAALLLDNEAVGQDYATATLEDILREHVTPYGIETVRGTTLPPVSRFSVASGSSEWSVVYDFCRYYGGVNPRFDPLGRLVLAPWPEEEVLVLGEGAPVTALSCRDRRYGVLSEIWIRDRVRQQVEKLEESQFCREGGMCRRVMTMPGRSDFRAMQYSGQFQLDKARSGRLRLEAEVAGHLSVRPGTKVKLERADWGRNGLYRAVEVELGRGSAGDWTRLELAETEIVL